MDGVGRASLLRIGGVTRIHLGRDEVFFFFKLSGWKKYKALSVQAESWKPVGILLALMSKSKPLGPIVEDLKTWGKIEGILVHVMLTDDLLQNIIIMTCTHSGSVFPSVICRPSVVGLPSNTGTHLPT